MNLALSGMINYMDAPLNATLVAAPILKFTITANRIQSKVKEVQ